MNKYYFSQLEHTLFVDFLRINIYFTQPVIINICNATKKKRIQMAQCSKCGKNSSNLYVCKNCGREQCSSCSSSHGFSNACYSCEKGKGHLKKVSEHKN